MKHSTYRHKKKIVPTRTATEDETSARMVFLQKEELGMPLTLVYNFVSHFILFVKDSSVSSLTEASSHMKVWTTHSDH